MNSAQLYNGCFQQTWIVAKYLIFDLETDNLRLTIGGGRNVEWSTWQSSIQQTLATTVGHVARAQSYQKIGIKLKSHQKGFFTTS